MAMDLLTARIVALEQLLTSGRFKPAAVQRDYQWDEWRAERLLKEITEAMLAATSQAFASEDDDEPGGDAALAEMDESEPEQPLQINEAAAEAPRAISGFFVGVVVLSPAANGSFDIFDGLQRITTLTILLSVLRDLIDDKALKTRLNSCIAVSEKDFRLLHAGSDTTLNALIQRSGEAGILRQNRSRPEADSGRHVFDVARRFVMLLRRRGQPELTAIAKFAIERVLVGVVETRDQRLARHIFVATNLYGLPLQRDEVFKGQILALAPSPEVAQEFELQWNAVRDLVGRKADDASQSKFEEFLIAFDAIWRRQQQGADCLGDLVDHLGQKPGAVSQFMRSLRTYAEAWKELEALLRSPTGGPIGNHVWRLSFFKWKEWKPLALHWIERHRAHGGDPKRQARTLWRFAQLNRRCMAVTLYEFGEETRASMFLQALRLASRQRPAEPFSQDGKRQLPLDFSLKVRQRIKDGLLLPIENYEVRRSLMLWYEASLWPKDLAPSHLSGGSIEHVLPDKPDLRSQWIRDFSSAEERYAMHNSLGNLAIVDAQVNDELGNKDFVHKKPILAGRNQYQKYRCLADVQAASGWTADVIRGRARIMAGQIWKELDLPEPRVPSGAQRRP
jgi:hypothetical protein